MAGSWARGSREGDALAAHLIGVFPLLQCGVVQLRAEGELLVQHVFLFLCWVETVLIGFLHTSVFFSGSEKGKFPHFLAPTRNAAFIHMWEAGAFSGGGCKVHCLDHKSI